jgi:hypothetical protein
MSLDELAQLWAAGTTLTDMGLTLGESRNVIAGRIDRARKSGDPRFQPRPVVASQPKPVVELESAVDKPAGPRLLIDLGWKDCRWPGGIPVPHSGDRTGNLPAFPGIFPDQPAPILRNSADGERELVKPWEHPMAVAKSGSTGHTKEDSPVEAVAV